MSRVQAELEIVAALATYQWTKTNVLYNFAIHLHYSETYVRRIITDLIAAGVIEKVADGVERGKTRFIYRVTQNV
jgi:predicted transcriptional regulator